MRRRVARRMSDARQDECRVRFSAIGVVVRGERVLLAGPSDRCRPPLDRYAACVALGAQPPRNLLLLKLYVAKEIASTVNRSGLAAFRGLMGGAHRGCSEETKHGHG
eukprot:GHVU01157412.1.p3 GENE.GHVU01157412.1~~GHVU01157412.1.p3  ORF type:complete len:107 (+),score=6.88 GHVU01157412.1:399-719(+)